MVPLAGLSVRSQASLARSFAMRPQGAIRVLSEHQFICGVPSRQYANALGVPGHLQRPLAAPCGRSWGARSSAMCGACTPPPMG